METSALWFYQAFKLNSSPASEMPDIVFTTPSFEKLLLNLNPTKASGPDLLPTRIIKLVAEKIAPVQLYNSLSNSRIPKVKFHQTGKM